MKREHLSAFILALCFLNSLALSVRAGSNPLRDKMDAYVRRYGDAELFSGVVRVTKGNRAVYENAFGLADRGLHVPNTLQTEFQIASLSKPITATAILLLVQDGKLALDDKLAKFVPDFPDGDRIC